MSTTTTENDTALRALYTAKAKLKEAASIHASAQHNFNCSVDDMSVTRAGLANLQRIAAVALAEYIHAERDYDAAWADCNSRNLL